MRDERIIFSGSGRTRIGCVKTHSKYLATWSLSIWTHVAISVEDVDELLLPNGADHDDPPLWIHRQILPRHDPIATGLA